MIPFVKSLVLSSVILAHSWYPADCCSGRDCRPVPCEEVITQVDGSVKYQDMTFRRDQRKASLDGDCHVCFNDSSRTTYCVFFPAGS